VTVYSIMIKICLHNGDVAGKKKIFPVFNLKCDKYVCIYG